ncbi:malate synthase [Pseudomonas duriflava]|uniref:Malate synthase n=1 Tax=Pseudomonas duriflava TaxID=459528 RepID=A0A562QL13_9PSED|nr:malate synthase G [Pseudomonas duriflava]TWI56736.1 malate synthase [Pseudomonas duriflava]
MTQRTQVGGLRVATVLYDFIESQALLGTGLDSDHFWSGLETLLDEQVPATRALLAQRAALQIQLDAWHRERFGLPHEPAAYASFLREIGYLHPDPGDVKITTGPLDAEVSQLAGPQLIAPATDAQRVLEAVNARWGSLYEALYETDAIPEDSTVEISADYNPIRGEKVVAYGRGILDIAIPLADGSHGNVEIYCIRHGELWTRLNTGHSVGLANPDAFVGYRGEAADPEALLLRHHGLHLEIQIDRTHPIGQNDPAGISDILLEAAPTALFDLEDSVAAVDAKDKVQAYLHWLGLMKGTLTAKKVQNGRTTPYGMKPDRHYLAAKGGNHALPGRSLVLLRTTGLLMTTDMILDRHGNEVPESILDVVFSSLCALHDLNSCPPLRTASVYLVMPKLHGPEEAAFANALFDQVEDLLKIPRHTLKLGLMNEERRTSINLKACLAAVKARVFLVATDRTDRLGDELHTVREAGLLLRKGILKHARWLKAYEEHNVAVSLACGFSGRAQISGDLWALPDLMASLLEHNIVHPQSGTTSAGVSSPRAATLHALHYHQVSVADRHHELATRQPPALDELLTLPVADPTALTAEEIQEELDSNAQCILGYGVRWIDQGIGWSRVPDLDEVIVQEDRATLRVSVQLLANWLRQGIVRREQIVEAFRRMALVVDQQNVHTPHYHPMEVDFASSLAFQTALNLIFDGAKLPNGYTEPILYRRRREAKAHWQ